MIRNANSFKWKATAAQLLHDLYTVSENVPTLLSQHSANWQARNQETSGP